MIFPFTFSWPSRPIYRLQMAWNITARPGWSPLMPKGRTIMRRIPTRAPLYSCRWCERVGSTANPSPRKERNRIKEIADGDRAGDCAHAMTLAVRATRSLSFIELRRPSAADRVRQTHRCSVTWHRHDHAGFDELHDGSRGGSDQLVRIETW